MQQERDRLAGLNTAGYVSGYRGSPLGGLDQQFMRAKSALEPAQHRVPARPQRGPRRDRALGHAAGRAARRGQVRRRVRHLVRQGPGRRPHRRRVPPRQPRRHLEARRRARPDGRRPHGGILDHRAPVRVPLRRRDDPDPQPGGRAGDPRLRRSTASRCRASAGAWVGAQMRARTTIESTAVGRRLARPREDRHPATISRCRRAGSTSASATACSTRKRGCTTTSAPPCSPSPAPTSSTASSSRGGRNPKIGIITVGKSYLDVRQALDELGIDEVKANDLGLRLYKVGCPWPLAAAS